MMPIDPIEVKTPSDSHRSFRLTSRAHIKKILFFFIPLIILSLLTFRIRREKPLSIQSIPPPKDARIISRVMQLIEGNYVDVMLVNPLDILHKASKNLERAIPPLLVKDSEAGLEINLSGKKLMIPVDPTASISDMATPMSHILGFVNEYYQGKPEEDDRTTIALTGATETLDPHTNYMSKKFYNEFKIGTKGNFGGLGIVIGVRQGVLTVISPLEDTPAFKAGIKAKDQIVQINEESTVNMNVSEAVDKLRGPVGTKVSIKIKREGEDSLLSITLTRALIHIQSVAGKSVENRFGLIRLKNFQQDTFEDFYKMYKTLPENGQKLEGLILDLRGNPGGLLDQAIQISDFFLKDGVIVKTVGGHGETIETETAKAGDAGEDIPLVVILDEGSASASEIVSGALKYNDRALIIGNRSFGKGSVQTVYDLKDGSGLKLTIAHYLTAHDQKVQSVGINPDIDLQGTTVSEKKIDLYEDVKKREIDLLNDQNDESKPDNLPPSPYTISYLLPDKDPEKEEDENTGKIKLDSDFSVILATRLLELSTHRNRKEVFEAVPALLEELEKTESEKTQTAMKKVGIDWTESTEDFKSQKPALRADLQLLDEKDGPVSALKASEKVTLKLSVENKSEIPLYQLIAVSQSEDPLFANIEFPLGKLLPHQKAEWRAPLKVPDFVRPRAVPMELVFHEKNKNNPENQSFSMTVEEPQVPVFSYEYSLLQDDKKVVFVEPDSSYKLKIKVYNKGNGDSKKPTINLKNAENNSTIDTAFIQKGHMELDLLKAGTSTEAVLEFKTPKISDQKKSVEFDLAIFDNVTGHEMLDHLLFPLKQESNQPLVLLDPLPEISQQAPVITLHRELQLTTNSNNYPIKGKLEDDNEVKHFSIFVGDDKVYYASPSPQNIKALSFDTKIPLKKGINFITLSAQDNRDLVSKLQWVIWKSE